MTEPRHRASAPVPAAPARRTASLAGWLYIAGIAAVTIAAAVLRGVRLDHPMRYDEAFTFLAYAFPIGPGNVFDYSTPNNHVFHTLLVYLVTQFAGPTPPAVRMPAFLAGVALAPAAAMLARRLTGRRLPGVLAAMLVAGASLLIEYSVNARGYTMICLFTLLMGVCTVELIRDARRLWLWVAWVLLGVAGMFTVPIMVYPLGLFALVLLLQAFWGPDRSLSRPTAIRLTVALLAWLALTALAYGPVIATSGLWAITGNRFVTPQPMGEVLAGLWPMAGETLGHWTRDTSWAWRILVLAGVLTSAGLGLARRAFFWLVPLLALALLTVAALAQRVIPFPRVWLFVLPLALVLAGCGLDWLAGAAFAGRRRLAAGLVVLLLAGVCAEAAWQSQARPALISEDERTLVDAQAICRDAVDLCDGQTALVSQVPAWPSLRYYSVLYGPVKVIDYSDDGCRRALVVVGDRQTLDGVLAANPGLAEQFGPPAVWRTYPHAKVYLAPRRTNR